MSLCYTSKDKSLGFLLLQVRLDIPVVENLEGESGIQRDWHKKGHKHDLVASLLYSGENARHGSQGQQENHDEW